jgi:homoserine dehydrogenase
MRVNVAVIGAGTVGGGVIRALIENGDVLRAKVGHDIRLTHVCELNEKNLAGLDLAGVTVTKDAESLFANPGIQVVCELIGGKEPARTLILKALRAGKHVVTANKMLLAMHGPELTRAAVEHRVELRYEAAVAGTIPIIKALREGLAANRIRSVHGILNGTCNYVLSRMTYEGLGFGEALRQAQAKGFAETPPDLDILGHDTAHKCQIIASLCFNSEVNLADIPVEGITQVTAGDIADAREMGYLIKLLAIVRDADGEIDARVHPTLVPEDNLLASVRNEFNAISVESDLAGPTLYYGRGAGRMPTASAVVADIADIARRGDAPPPPPFRYDEARRLRGIGRHEGEYYLRFTTADETGVLGRICTILGEHKISIASCSQKDPHGENSVHVVIMTHNALESELRSALARIDALDVIIEPTHVLRVLAE